MEAFETYRSLLFSIAYRMLGSASDAEDMVQETYLRYRTAQEVEIRSLKSFLMTVITRLCLDELKSARVQREQYLGPWLPEPVLTGGAETLVEQRESLSLAFLKLLEELTPAERAVFVLHEAFDYPYDEIGNILDKNAAACRQLFHRAEERLAAHQRRFEPSLDAQRELVGRFLLASQSGNVQALTELLARDVVVWSDGGGKVSAATRPVYGQERVIRFLQGLLWKSLADLAVSVETINDSPALLFWTGETLFMASSFRIADGQIQEAYGILNPDKLAYLQRQLRERESASSVTS
ncbi:MAG TPA: RNA polymerase sigma-70 factor [Ktedonobacterales bacterium]|nr:RNA polymerase sigma-70 factor [Ktedonobacterales bacterium]